MNASLALFFEDDARPFVSQLKISTSFCRMVENWDLDSPILFLGGHSVINQEPPNFETGLTKIKSLYGAYGLAVRRPYFLKLSKMLREYLLVRGNSKSSPDVMLASYSSRSNHPNVLATPMIVDHHGNHYSFTWHTFRKNASWEGDPKWWMHTQHKSIEKDEKRPTVVFKDENFKLCHYEKNSNFGDNLGPFIVEQILKLAFKVKDVNIPIFNVAKHRRAKHQVCLFHLGSVIHFATHVDHIWGSGVMFNNRQIKSAPPISHIYAVRGLLTAEKLKSGWKPTAMGDPGRLIQLIELTTDKYCGSTCAREICFVPHMKDANVYKPSIESTVHVFWPNTTWTDMVEKLSGCRYVICSSLHCLIISDTLGIPNRWVQFEGSGTEKIAGQFKFQDYFTSINSTRLQPTRAIDEAVALGPSRKQDNFNANKLLDSFPYHLFHVSGSATI